MDGAILGTEDTLLPGGRANGDGVEELASTAGRSVQSVLSPPPRLPWKAAHSRTPPGSPVSNREAAAEITSGARVENGGGDLLACAVTVPDCLSTIPDPPTPQPLFSRQSGSTTTSAQ